MSELYPFRLYYAVYSNKPTAGIAQQDIHDNIDDSEQELPDHVLHPQEYNMIETNSFENVNYVSAS